MDGASQGKAADWRACRDFREESGGASPVQRWSVSEDNGLAIAPAQAVIQAAITRIIAFFSSRKSRSNYLYKL